jgi:hypothetical protein
VIRRPLIVLILVMGVLVLGAAAARRFGLAGPPSSCVGSASSLVSTTDLGDYVAMGKPTLMSEIPFLSRREPIKSSFLRGASSGFITSDAMSGPFRIENDDLARSRGYQIGPWPVVPLEGRIVGAGLGPLEIYETVFVFRDRAGLDAYLNVTRGEASGLNPISVDGQTPATSVMDQPNGDLLVLDREGPDDGLHEQVIGLHHVDGTVDIQIAIRGGSDITPRDAQALLAIAMGRFTSACHDNNP